MTTKELEERVAALEAELQEAEEDISSLEDELKFEKQTTEELHRKIDRCREAVGTFEPVDVARELHTFLCDEGLIPGDVPWKISTEHWREKLTGVVAEFAPMLDD